MTLLVLLLACANPPGRPAPPPPGDAGDPRASCASYRGDPEAWGYCLATRIRGVDRGEVEAICGEAGAWEADCRTRWVGGQLTRLGRKDTPGGLGVLVRDKALVAASDALVDVCLDDDCRFQAVDRWRDADLPHQLTRCLRAGRYVRECAFHAAQSWEGAEPSVEAALEIWPRMPAVDPSVRLWGEQAVGHALACHGAPCPEDDPEGICRAAWEDARTKGCKDAMTRP